MHNHIYIYIHNHIYILTQSYIYIYNHIYIHIIIYIYICIFIYACIVCTGAQHCFFMEFGLLVVISPSCSSVIYSGGRLHWLHRSRGFHLPAGVEKNRRRESRWIFSAMTGPW